MHALFGGLCLARPHSLSLSLSPDYALLERLFERASPAHAPLEHPGSSARMSARPPLTHCSNACSSVRSPAPPPAPRSISKDSLRPVPRSRVSPVLRHLSIKPEYGNTRRERAGTIERPGVRVPRALRVRRDSVSGVHETRLGLV